MEFNTKYDAVMQVKKDRVLLARAGLRQTRYIKDFPNLVVAEFESEYLENSTKCVVAYPINNDKKNLEHWDKTHLYIDTENRYLRYGTRNEADTLAAFPKGYEEHYKIYGDRLEEVLTMMYLEGYPVYNLYLEDVESLLRMGFDYEALQKYEEIKSKPYYLEKGDDTDDY